MNNKTHIRLMTYNIGGGRKDLGSKGDKVMQIIKNKSPDILAIQEATKRQEEGGKYYSELKEIFKVLGSQVSKYFGPTLNIWDNFHVRKALFVEGVFNGWENWWQGNALFTKYPFVCLGKGSGIGTPKNIPLFVPPRYEGNRNTDPRFVIIGRVNCETIQPFVLVTHFTTLLGERGGKRREIPGKDEDAQKTRWEQAQRLLDLVQEHIIDQQKTAFLLGDFNADETEPCISNVLVAKAGFVRLKPEKDIPTHPKRLDPVDHIFIYPGNMRIEYKCWIVDDDFTASDHNPVVADIVIYDKFSQCYQDFGPGVVRKE